MTELESLIGIEDAFWTGDAEYHRRRLTADFLMIVPAMGVMTRDGAIEGLSGAPRWSAVDIQDPRLVPLTSDSVALTYSVSARREGDARPYRALASSVYVLRNDSWLLALHHQSPLD